MLAFQPVFLVQLLLQHVQGADGRRRTRGSANTLEWLAPSPPPHGNFAEMPVVYRGPYEYSVPGPRRRLLAAALPDGAPCQPRPRRSRRRRRTTCSVDEATRHDAQRDGGAHRPPGRLVGARVGNRDLRRPARRLHHAPPRPPAPGPTRRRTPTPGPAAFNTLVLLTSSLSAVLAHQAAERGDGQTAAQFLLPHRRSAARRS